MSQVLGELRAEGYPIAAEVLAALSPCQTAHYIRCGRYTLDLTWELPPLDYAAPILSTPPAQEVPRTAPR